LPTLPRRRWLPESLALVFGPRDRGGARHERTVRREVAAIVNADVCAEAVERLVKASSRDYW
jgi:hypothetical protein